MKILMFCDFKGNLGDSIRISNMFKYLKDVGNEVTMCNLRHYYEPKAKLIKHPKLFLNSMKNIRSDILVKNLIYADLGKTVVKKTIEKSKPDAILAVGIKVAYMALNASKGIPIFVDVHGIVSAEYEEGTEKNIISDNYLSELKKMESYVYKNAQRVFVVSGN